MGQELCSDKKCEKPVHSRSFCRTHYNKNIFYPAHPLYPIWAHMIQRCYDPREKRYADWGGRGIRVCDRWKESYKNFEKDMGVPPKNHQLERIDNDGDYTPDNCRWATRIEQARNRRLRADNKSGFGGVSYHRQTGKWRAEITINKKVIYLGLRPTLQEAIDIRLQAEKEYNF